MPSLGANALNAGANPRRWASVAGALLVPMAEVLPVDPPVLVPELPVVELPPVVLVEPPVEPPVVPPVLESPVVPSPLEPPVVPEPVSAGDGGGGGGGASSVAVASDDSVESTVSELPGATRRCAMRT